MNLGTDYLKEFWLDNNHAFSDSKLEHFNPFQKGLKQILSALGSSVSNDGKMHQI